MKTRNGWLILSVLYVQTCSGIHWNNIRCAFDIDETVPLGLLPPEQMGKFSWIGIIQHDFYLGDDELRHAITGAVLIHPNYALAPAEDMAKIKRETITNTTRFITWYNQTIKHVMMVEDYIIHHDYELETTYATIALVEIVPDGVTWYDHPAGVLSICLPFKGSGTYDNLYVVRMTDQTGELRKEVTKVAFVDKEDCDAFYEKAELDYKLMVPSESLCVTALEQQPACVLDGGAALITKKDDTWILLGFGTKGPGCGAPARFIDVNSHLEWIDIQITAIPIERAGEDPGFMLRSVSPIEIVMYKPGEHSKTTEGQCRPSSTTSVVYRDSSEVITTSNYGRGYFFLALADQSDFSCLLVNLHCNMRSNAAMWVEHHCYRDVTGMHVGQDKRRIQCYKYFKSTAYVEFRFTFSYLAKVEVKVFGSRAQDLPPNPWAGQETTLTWWPTDGESHALRWGLFVPVEAWWNSI